MNIPIVFLVLFLAFLAPSHELRTYIQGKVLSLPDGVVALTNGKYEVNHEFNRVKYNLHILDGLNGKKQAKLAAIDSIHDKDELVKRLIIKILQDNKGFHDSIDIYDEKGNLVNGLTCNLDYNANTPIGELVDFITDECIPLCKLSRSVIHKYNLLHCGIGCLIFNTAGNELFVHKRSKHKRLFPDMLDMFIGGVCSSGESPEVTLLRELSEEVGLDYISSKASIMEAKIAKTAVKKTVWDNNDAFILAWSIFQSTELYDELFSSAKIDKNVVIDNGGKVKCLGRCTIFTSYNHCIVYVYAVTTPISQVISFKDGEIDAGTYMTFDKVQNLVLCSRDQFVPDGLQVWDQLPVLI